MSPPPRRCRIVPVKVALGFVAWKVVALLAFVAMAAVGCAAIMKPCPACHTPNNPADYPMPDDNGDNPSDMTKKPRPDGGIDR